MSVGEGAARTNCIKINVTGSFGLQSCPVFVRVVSAISFSQIKKDRKDYESEHSNL